MEIKGEDYVIIPSKGVVGDFWDLEVLVLVKPRDGGEPRKEFKNVAYGCSLSGAIKRIAKYRLLKKFNKDSVSLEQFVCEYRNQCENIEKLCKDYEEKSKK